MVKKILIGKKVIYQCEDCKLIYENKEWAKKCEEWCFEHHNCNISIASHKLNSGLN